MLPVADFYAAKGRATGLSPYCKPCTRSTKQASTAAVRARDPEAHSSRLVAYQRAYRNKHPDRVKTYQRGADLRRKYKLTIAEYDAKLIAQKGRCMICKKTPEENGRPLPVDHNHQTGQLRDLLCDHCNKAIGFLNEDPKLARKLIKYLERWQSC